MKKLLAAVTSVAMSASFITSAFASSFTVSAAGGVSAVQPNISTEEVLDEAATKKADNETKTDFTIEPEARTAKPGETIENIPVIIQSNGRSVATLVFELPEDLPAGWKVEPSELGCYCSELEGVEFKKLDKTYNVNTLQPGKGHPMPIIDGAEMVYINITVPADAKPGDYEYYFNRFFVVEATKPELIQYNGTILPGKITIEGDTPAETTTKTPVGTTTKAPDTTKAPVVTTTQAAPADGSVEWVIPKVTAKAGSEVTMEVKVKGNGDLAVAGASFDVEAKAPITLKSVTADGSVYTQGIVNKDDKFAFAEIFGIGNTAKDGDLVFTLVYNVPANTAAGIYPVEWTGDMKVSDTNGNIITEKVKFTSGEIEIVEDPKFDGEIAWDIQEVHALPGETVELPVIINDPDATKLPIAGAQFGITVESPIQLNGADSALNGYGSAVVFNTATNQFAFGEHIGVGVPSEDGKTVLTLLYTVPANTPAGEYDVTWGGKIYISDTNGNSLTDQVSLLDGKIIVDDDKTEGDITWDIPEKKAKPGEEVTLDVIVNVGTKNIPVAGAQFEINCESPIEFKSTSGSEAYTGAIVNNPATNQFAFGNVNGVPVEAKDGSVVLQLKYTVPANTPAGTYPVTWGGKIFISDTNGNEITSIITDDAENADASIKLLNGAIIIEEETTTAASTTTTKAPETTTKAPDTTTTKAPETTTTKAPETTTKAPDTTKAPETTTTVTAPEGAIIWAIQTVEANPGEEVTVDVLVNDSKNVNLPIGGAQFIINNADAPIVFNGATGSEAYGADIVTNPNTFQYAFANKNGAGVGAADGSKVISLTFTVPAETPAGVYPVTWGDDGYFFVSSADGLDMSSQILTIDGAIIVKALTTTTKAPETTTKAPETTTTKAPETTTKVPETTTTKAPETTTKAPETTTTVTAPEGAIIWAIQTVEANPGEEVTVDVLVNDSKNVNLPIGGAQFIINNADAPIVFNGATGSEAYGADIVTNPNTFQYAFANKNGAGVGAANGSKVISLTFTVPEGTPAGIYPVTWGDDGYFFVSSADGLDMSKQVLTINGAIIVKALTTTTKAPETTTTKEPDTTTTKAPETTTTKEPDTTTTKAPETTTTKEPDTTTTKEPDTTTKAPDTTTTKAPDTTTTVKTTQMPGGETTTTTQPPILPPGVYVKVETVDGFYFSHDPGTFRRGHVDDSAMEGEDIEVIKEVDGQNVLTTETYDSSKLTFAEAVSNADNPMDAFVETTNIYTVNVLYDGMQLRDDTGEAITFTAYIGVKGDSNLDNIVDPQDASYTLSFYANASTLPEGGDKNTVMINNPELNEKIANSPVDENGYNMLDMLCAFLIDVDLDVYDEDNWNMLKVDREIDPADASWILSEYAVRSTDTTKTHHEAWNEVLASQGRVDKFNDYLISVDRVDKFNAYIEAQKKAN